jgi:Ser/Thr protein kinase RdoA (MazF antagonist)
VVGEISSGPRQRLWRGDLGGRTVVIHEGRRSQDALDWELNLRVYLRARGVLSPGIFPTATGRLRDGRVYVEEFVEGATPSSGAQYELVAATVSGLHQMTRGYSQRPGFLCIQELLRADRGGDIDLALLPKAAVDLVRQQWTGLPLLSHTVVHSDLRPDNIRLRNQHCVLLDWDEAHVDSPWLDLVELPDWEPPQDLGYSRARVERAALAWEVAACWRLEPAYSRERLRQLRRRSLEVERI